jgi:hypothetical protein
MNTESHIKHIESILPLVFKEEAESFWINVYLHSDAFPKCFKNDFEERFELLIVLETT